MTGMPFKTASLSFKDIFAVVMAGCFFFIFMVPIIPGYENIKDHFLRIDNGRFLPRLLPSA
jgi:hypothetical protein